ncbi:N-acetyltransferase [Pseudomonas sp. AOB-7]|jgi:ribosomal protein S18 acetylase RimI-like enzyme|uniref:GNAT family N-acetyltransferase n=1 Tax=Pseudomonas sp. AOB-7 TaxID=2482750 RepID=UPI000EFB05FE|nr:GNAT family N-acetyltransferase [Pseudomonas sp. AOB-7]RMH83615.1 N-acetyltransferase [Pseudomonas sp. AOB-7]
MPTFELNLRPIADADLAFLQALYASTRADEVAQLPWDKASKDAFLAQQFTAQHQYYKAHYQGAALSLICMGECAIGRLYIFRGPTTLNLIDISLLPEWCGQGIGSHFLRALTDEADATGKTIRLFVEPTNPARRLYERCGFGVTGSNHIYLQMQRTPAPALAVSA